MIVKRYKFVQFLIFVLFLIVLIKAFDVSILNHEKYIKKYTKNMFRTVQLEGRRGYIYDSSGRILAMDYPSYTVFVDPNYYYRDIEFHIKHRSDKGYAKRVEKFIERLSKILSKPPEYIKNKIEKNREKRFVVLKRNLTLDEFNTLSKSFVPNSFGFIKGFKRYYPDGEYSSHDIGFCFANGEGAEGLEKYYDEYLKAAAQKERVSLDVYRKRTAKIPKNGYDVYTTVDKNIQDFVHINLAKTVEKYDADGGIVIVMNPDEGSIIAMDSYPYYNNNKYYDYKYNYIRNRAVADVFEPGSVFKLITLSAALDSGIFRGDELLYCENGRWKFKNKIIHDVHRFKWLDFDNVFIHSSNIGSAKIALTLGKKTFYKYLIKYGFGCKTGIDIISESKGIVKDIFNVSDVGLANMAFGQGISVTALQLAVSYSVIANGGYRVKPHFIKFISDNNRDIYTYKSHREKILKDSTIVKVKNILKRVVENGTGKRAAIKGYSVSGKTGTAQVPKKGSYKTREYIASFAGFAPSDNPKIVIVVSIFNPKRGGFYGGTVAAPLFADIADFSLHYYAVAKDK